MQKLYCYVDESGQETGGRVFIVGVVAVPDDLHHDLLHRIEGIEREVNKRKKWGKSERPVNHSYMRRVIDENAFRGRMFYGIFHEADISKQGDLRMKANIVSAIVHMFNPDARVVVFIDGEQKRPAVVIGAILRAMRIRVEHVRTIRREETSALSRLADAICGLISDVSHNNDAQKLFEKAKRNGAMQDAREE